MFLVGGAFKNFQRRPILAVALVFGGRAAGLGYYSRDVAVAGMND